MSAQGAGPKVKYENERRYTDEGAYYMPNDQEEAKRLDTQHQIWLDSLDSKLFLSPVDLNHASVLEVGAGSGIWAIQCAQSNPTAQILGIDLSDIQPNDIPKNCAFAIADAEKDWSFATQAFELIHSRLLVQGLHDWSQYFQRCLEHLKPGGWCEVQEIHYPMYCADPNITEENSPFLKWSHIHKAAGAKAGIDSGAAKNFKRMLQDAGFDEVRETIIRWPYGQWGDDEKERTVGRLGGINMRNGLRAFSMALLTRHGELTREEAETICQEALEDLNSSGRRYYGLASVHCARKMAVSL